MTPAQQRELDARHAEAVQLPTTRAGALDHAWDGMLSDRAAELQRELDADSDGRAVMRKTAELLVLLVERLTTNEVPR